MRVIHCFDMANDGFSTVKGLRKIGVDCDLIFQRPEHVCSLPMWEEAAVDMTKLGDLYDPNWEAFSGWDCPSWIRVWDTRKAWYPFSRSLKWARFLKQIWAYDLVVGHVPFARFASFYKKFRRKPYLLVDEGWGRVLDQDKKGYAEARRGYRDAAAVLFTNVDMEPMFYAPYLQRQNGDFAPALYVPFAIDTDLYRPSPTEQPSETLFFHPTRHRWNGKGNDRLIRAFGRYVKRNPKARLKMVNWRQSQLGGDAQDDFQQSLMLIGELGIARNVQFVEMMPKKQLIKEYQAATAVCDQFIVGALGTTGIEALSCGTPLIANAQSNLWLAYHDEAPPVMNAQTEQEIYDKMVSLEDVKFREERGRESRRWVIENCKDTVVAKRHLEIYEKVLSGELQ